MSKSVTSEKTTSSSKSIKGNSAGFTVKDSALSAREVKSPAKRGKISISTIRKAVKTVSSKRNSPKQ